MNIFKKRMTLIAYFFLRLPPAKHVVRYLWKKSRFRLPFRKKHGKRVSSLFKFEQQNLYHIYWSTIRQFSCKKPLLVICKSLRLFVNTLSDVDKCSLPNRHNLMQPIYMNLSQKLKIFLNFCCIFKIYVKFWTFSKKKMMPIAYLFVRLRPAKIVVRYICKKSRFRLPFQKKHGKRASTLFKSGREQLRHNYCLTGKQFSGKNSHL